MLFTGAPKTHLQGSHLFVLLLCTYSFSPKAHYILAFGIFPLVLEVVLPSASEKWRLYQIYRPMPPKTFPSARFRRGLWHSMCPEVHDVSAITLWWEADVLMVYLVPVRFALGAWVT